MGEGRAEDAPAINRARILISCLSPSIYPLVEEDETSEQIVATIKAAYIKKKNNAYARHLLVSLHQQPGESVTEYAQTLKALAKECIFAAVTAEEYRAELTRDAFINGLSSPFIRQRILEKDELNLVQAVELADGLDRAQKQAVQMGRETVMTVPESDPHVTFRLSQDCSLSAFTKRKCLFCGGKLHAGRRSCPAVNDVCHNCNKRGHFANVCKSKAKDASDNVLVGSAAGALASSSLQVRDDNCFSESLCSVGAEKLFSIAAAPANLGPAVIKAKLKDQLVDVLIDTGASDNFINRRVADELQIEGLGSAEHISLPTTKAEAKIDGKAVIDIDICGKLYRQVQLRLMSDLCADVILGQKFLRRHSELT